MIPNDFGIIRQKAAEHDLFALPFFPLDDVNGYSAEVVYPDFVIGKGLTGSGSEFARAANAYGVADCSKYEYVLFYILTDESGGRLSGFRGTADSGVIQGNGQLTTVPTAAGDGRTAYSLAKVPEDRPFVCVNTLADHLLPIIGFVKDV